MRKKELKRTILKTFGRDEFYGYELHRKLNHIGIEIGTSRLYKVLDEMLQDNLLTDRWEKSQSGPNKRVYQLTEGGKSERNNLLLDAIKTVHDFYIEYLLDLPSDDSPFDAICETMAGGLSEQATIACIVHGFSTPFLHILKDLQSRIPEGTAYFVSPRFIDAEVHFGMWRNVTGSCNNIPLKDDSLDLLLLPGFRENYSDAETLRECGRVLSEAGRLAIVTPSVLTKNHETPLSIGTFIEMYEHQMIEKMEPVNWEHFKTQLHEVFERVEETIISDITVLVVSGSVETRQ